MALKSLFYAISFFVLLAYCVQAGDVAFTKYDLSISNLIWSGVTNVFLITQDGLLYRSADEGQTWAAQIQLLPKGAGRSVVRMYQDKVDDKKILFVGNGLLDGWFTTNAGSSYTYVSFGFQTDGFDFHPGSSGWLLAFSSCSSPSGCTVRASQDMGASWEMVAQDVYDASWGKKSDNEPNTVYILRGDLAFGYTADFGKTFVTLFKDSIGFVFTHEHLFVGLSVANSLRDVVLMVSNENHQSVSSYQEAQFPFGDNLPDQAYYFLDDSTGAEWIGVVHNRQWGTIYISGAKGLKYTTSLQHAHHDDSFFDFDVFHGLEGIYIANNVSNYEQTTGDLERTTIITFDNGGEWKYLRAPSTDANGNPIYCTGKCSLHLNGLTSWSSQSLGPFYSSPNAIGLLLATGNVGEFLSPDKNDVNTYFSRDAGLTWFELTKGAHIYEFGDHGGIIVFASTTGPTNSILYSVDEGLHLTSASFPGNPVTVENIIAEPTGTARKFILYGTDHATGNGVILGLDFTNVQPRPCTDSDYEDWSPSDGRANGQTCQLGRNVTYSRRKRDANCFNARDTDHVVSSVNCSCTLDDYECDFGFEEAFEDGKLVCVLRTVNPPVYPPKDCAPGASYTISKGYRLVTGDTCKGELPDFKPEVKPCPVAPGKKGSGSTILVVALVLVGLVLCGVAGFLVYRNEAWREKIVSLFDRSRTGPEYSRLAGGRLADEEFGIGGDHDLDDSDVEEDAPVLQDKDIQQATASDKDKRNDDFDPRS